ncbi:MAG: S-layer homology domain-containing protein [Ruminococcaceae bacterium]|nr:S-layer homology domain-containing protein [Oscillospiraceae bacterium]
MKKFTLILSTVALFLCLFTVSAFAVEWVFDNETEKNAWTYTGMDSVLSDDGVALAMNADDNYMSRALAAGERINATDYRYVAMVMKVESKSTYGAIFYVTDQSPSMGSNHTHIGLSNNTGEWQGYVFDMSALSANWKGELSTFRIDPINAADINAKITVARVGIFKTKAEADAFVENLPNNTATENTEVTKPAPEVSSDVESKGWILSDPTETANWKFTGMKESTTDEGVALEMTSDDNFMTRNLQGEEVLNTAEYHYLSLVMKVESKVNYGAIFYITDQSTNMGSNHTHFNLSNNTGEWRTYIFDMSSISGKWKGNLSTFRIDPINAADRDAKVTVARMGIFKSKTDAQAFADADPVMYEQAAKKEAELAAKKELYADMESPKFIFDSYEAVDQWSNSGSDISFRFGYLCMVPKHNDPIMEYKFETPFPASEFKYFAIRIKPISTFLSGALFFSNTVYNGYSDKSHIPFALEYNKWKNVIINMEDSFPERWTGEVNKFRLDPINPGYYDKNAEIYLDRCGFFRTQEEAEKFLSSGREDFDYSHESVITREMSQTIIPGGSITDGYDPAKYIITNTADASTAKDAVVMFTDANGKETPVALSYVNGAGYVTYTARNAGTYKIGYNTKAFTDTDGHWASENIKFVADRALFGGTSPTEFSPDMTMTRGMFITVLGRMHGLDVTEYDGNTGYADVKPTEYYAPYIKWATEQKLANGVNETAFAPEEPITRKDMALITSNYMKAFNYNVKLMQEVEAFNDLEGFSNEEKEAIILIQKAGIINGKGAGRFDPHGISTRAEVATVMQRIIKSILRVNILYSQNTAEYISRDRIRIGVWSYYINPNEGNFFETLANAGFDNVVGMGFVTPDTYDLADKYAVEMFTGSMSRSLDTNANPVFMNAAIYDHPSFGGSYLGDEPGTTQFDALSACANDYIQKLPGKVPFINLLPMYANAAQLKYDAGAAAIEYYDSDPNLYRKYCDEYCEKFDTTYICVDIYPLHSASTYNDYVESVNQVASSARDHGKEFWCCLQAFGFNGSKRTPVLNEYYWQCFTLLSFGCRNLIWWYYEGNENFPSLIDRSTMQTTQAYDDSKAVISVIKAISDTFIQYNNVGAFTVNCTSKTPYLKISNEYKDFDAITEIICDEPLLVGCFDKKDGNGHAFTLVNMTELLEKKSATIKFKIADNRTVTSYKSGAPTVLTPVDGYYTVTLDWGMGEFFTIA